MIADARQSKEGARLLILASASPRRARILESLGVPFRVIVPDADERAQPGESVYLTVERLAHAKAASIETRDSAPILAADTIVVVDETPLGKPRSAEEAREMLQRLSGRTHEVLTGICLRTGDGSRTAHDSTQVSFRNLDQRSIDWYVRTGEPLDKAGGYHIDGIGAFFVASIHGSPSNVAGLPVSCLLDLARRAGVALGPP
jgi:septum formation protein